MCGVYLNVRGFGGILQREAVLSRGYIIEYIMWGPSGVFPAIPFQNIYSIFIITYDNMKYNNNICIIISGKFRRSFVVRRVNGEHFRRFFTGFAATKTV